MSQQPYPYPQDQHSAPGRPAGYEPPVTHPGYISDDERAASVVAHLSAPAAAILSAGWVSFLGPLLVWFAYKDRSPAVRRAAAGAFNFNVAFSVMYVIGWILLFSVIGAPLALLLWAVIFVVAGFCHIKGAIASMRGQTYDYPFQIRILN